MRQSGIETQSATAGIPAHGLHGVIQPPLGEAALLSGIVFWGPIQILNLAEFVLRTHEAFDVLLQGPGVISNVSLFTLRLLEEREENSSPRRL